MRKPIKEIEIEGDDEAHTIMQVAQRLPPQYPPAQAPKSLEQWKVAITAVGQGYEWTNIHYNYRTGSGITYGGMGKPMEIGRQQNNGQGRKPKCYNCNKFRHMAKDCRQPKKEKKQQECFKCGKEEHIAIGCRAPQQMKTRSSQREDSDDKEQKGFVKGSEEARYDEPL